MTIDEETLQKEIMDIQDQVNNNTIQLEHLTSKDWYSNKELFEMMQDLSKNLKKYNGLIEERERDRELLEQEIKRLDKVEEKIEKIEIEEKTEEKIVNNWKEWVGWFIATLLALIQILSYIGVI